MAISITNRHALRRGATITSAALLALGIGFVSPGVASAVLPPVTAATAGAVYNNIPVQVPGNVPSEAFEAQSASEFGSAISMTSLSVTNPVVTVLLSSWGCENGNWFSNNCSTTPGTTFSEPVTVNIYALGPATAGSAPGALLLSQTSTFDIPYRPSSDAAHCAATSAGAGAWYSVADGACYNGYATPITFHLIGHLATSQVVVSVAYNTTHYGYAPYGENTACYTSDGGCGYDSLNVGLTAPPSVGHDPRPADAYLNSSWSGAYCSPSNPGVGSFVADPGCWSGYQPAVRIQQGAVGTILKANPSIARVISPRIYLKLSARLTTSAGNPVLGEPISFTAAGHAVCVAVTNSNGTAACSGFLTGVPASIISLGYYAHFAGDGVLLPKSAHGFLLRLL